MVQVTMITSSLNAMKELPTTLMTHLPGGCRSNSLSGVGPSRSCISSPISSWTSGVSSPVQTAHYENGIDQRFIVARDSLTICCKAGLYWYRGIPVQSTTTSGNRLLEGGLRGSGFLLLLFDLFGVAVEK